MKRSPVCILAALFLAGACHETDTSEADQVGAFPEPDRFPGAPVPMLRIFLTDAPAPELRSLFVTIDRVDVRMVDEGWIRVTGEPQTFDLLALTDVLAPLATSFTLPQGSISGVRLVVSSASAVTVARETVPVVVPSGDETGLKIDVALSLVPGVPASFTLDFDARESVIANSNGLLLKPVIRVLDVTSAVPLDGATVGGSGIRLTVPPGASDALFTATLTPLANVPPETLAPFEPEFQFVAAAEVDFRKLDGSPLVLDRHAEIEVDNTFGLTRDHRIPVAGFLEDLTGDGTKDPELIDTAYAIDDVVKTAHNGFLRGVGSSGIYGFFAATTDIYYPFGDTEEGALGPTGVIATAEINGRTAAFMSRTDGGGRWVLPIPLLAENATVSLTLTDSFTGDVSVTTLDLPAKGAGAFLAQANIAAPYPPRGQSTAHIPRLGHQWDVPVEFGVLSRAGGVFVAVDQDTFQANRASVEFEFPNAVVRSEFVGSEGFIFNGELSIFVPMPRLLPRGWSLGSNETPFARMSVRAYRTGNDPVVTFPLVLELALAIAPGDADSDGLDDVDEVFTCGSDPTQIDSDGDGFDDLEECATGRDGFDLRGASALAYKRDIFIELDAMLASGHSDQLSSSAREQFAEVFEREGYQVHIDVGQDVGTGGPFTGGNPISHRDDLADTCAGQSVIKDFVAPIRAANFNESARGRVFYYGLMAHSICGDVQRFAVGETPGSTFVINRSGVLSERFRAIWMLHAMGHNMGLRHGGMRDCPSFKRNYNSIMNPFWAGDSLLDPGIDTDCDLRGNPAENAIGFSHGTYLTLDERHLSEPQGLCGTNSYDWDFDGNIEPDVAADTNSAETNRTGFGERFCADADVPSLDVLSDHDDWAALQFFADVDRPIPEPRSERF